MGGNLMLYERQFSALLCATMHNCVSLDTIVYFKIVYFNQLI